MDYVPGNEPLQPGSLRLPEAAWNVIKERAQRERMEPLAWLRLQIYDRILNGSNGHKARKRKN